MAAAITVAMVADIMVAVITAAVMAAVITVAVMAAVIAADGKVTAEAIVSVT